jgi:hypothetical protein
VSARALSWSAPQGALPLGAVFGGLAALGCITVGLLGLDHLPFTVCVFKATTGLPCPSCGATRAFGRLFRMDLAGALAMNPLVVLTVLGLWCWGALDLLLLPRGRSLRLDLGPPLANPARLTAVGLVAANWAYLLLAGR